MTHWAIFTDASGDGRIAVVVMKEGEEGRFNELTTKVKCQGAWEAEYLAVRYVFDNLHDLTGQVLAKGDDIVVSTDSEYVVKQLRQEYKVKRPELKPYYKRIIELLGLYARNGLTIHFEWIPRERNPAGHILESKESRAEKPIEKSDKTAKDLLSHLEQKFNPAAVMSTIFQSKVNLTILSQAIEDVSLDYEVTKPNEIPTWRDVVDTYDRLIYALRSDSKKKS